MRACRVCARTRQSSSAASLLRSARCPTEPSLHRNLKSRRQRARRLIRAAKSGQVVNLAHLEAARVRLLSHHGTRGTEILTMSGKDGFTKIGKKGKKHKVHQEDWKCDKCSAGQVVEDWHFVFKKKDACNKCDKRCPKNPTRYGHTKAGKAELAARGGNGGWGGGGGGGASGGGGGGNNDSSEIRKLRAQLKDANKKLEAKVANDDDDDSEGDDDEGMDTDEVKTKAQLEQIVLDTQGDIKYAEEKLKTTPKNARYLGMLEASKAQLEEAREQLRELKDPVDQLHHQSEKLKKLANKDKKLREQLREDCKVEAELAEQIATLREQIHDNLEETERVKAQQKALVNADGGPGSQGPPTPVDLSLAVEAMQGDFTLMFADTALPSSVADKKDEMEAAFTSMRGIMGTLTAIQSEFKLWKQPTLPPPLAAGSHAPPPSLPASGGAAADPSAEATRSAATVDPAPSTQTPAVRNGSSSQEERNSNRERTPPPGRSSKTIAKKSDEELLGPRRANLAKTTAKPAGEPGSTVA